MSIKWQDGEKAYLASNYASTPMVEMVAAIGRTHHAIHAEARVLGIKRLNNGRFDGSKLIGKPFQPGNKPWNAREVKPITLRDKVIAEFAVHRERTTRQLSASTGSRRTACWKVCNTLCNELGIHINRWEHVSGSVEATYRIGIGKNAVKPDRKVGDDPYRVLPVPAPQLGPWGCVWNTTTAATAAREDIAP